MKLSRIKKLVFLHLQHLPMKSRGWRPTLCKWGGVNIKCPKKTFIGEDVIFDTNYPEDIVIEGRAPDCRRPDCNAFHEPEDRQL